MNASQAGSMRSARNTTWPDVGTPPTFDEVADGYDSEFSNTQVARRLRGIVHNELARITHAGDRVLDLGCGTGEDVLWLARRGIRALGIDASPRMIGLARAKAAQAALPLGAEPTFEVADVATGHLPDGPFDLALANFGVLNCIADRPAFAQRLARVVRPEGWALFVVIGRYCPWEWGWYLARGRPRSAFRRLGGAAPFRGATVHYTTPAAIAREFSPHFDTVRTSAMGVLIPPSYAASLIEKRPVLANSLFRLEQPIRHLRVAANLSDHFIIEMRRR